MGAMNDYYVNEACNVEYETKLANFLLDYYDLDLGKMPDEVRAQFFHGLLEITSTAASYGKPFGNAADLEGMKL